MLGGLGSVLGDDFASVGRKTGDFFSKILGFGDYEIKSNSIVEAVKTGSEVPLMHSESDSVVLRHREYIGDVLGTTDFATTVYAINPGLSSSFPWLSAIAQNFTEYKFKGLVFEYKTTSSPFVSGSNVNLGTVMLASQYNVHAPVFGNKVAVDNNQWTTSGRPSDSFLHPVECASNLTAYNHYFLRSGSVPSGDEVRLYDMMYLTVATNGMPTAGTVIGELWATYEVEVFKPQLTGALLLNAKEYIQTFSGVDASNLVGTATSNYYSNIPITIEASYVSASVKWKISLPKNLMGVYCFHIRKSCTGTATAISTVTYSGLIKTAAEDPGSYSLATTNYATYTDYYYVSNLNSAPSVTLYVAAPGTETSTTVNLVVTQINGHSAQSGAPLLTAMPIGCKIVPTEQKDITPYPDEEEEEAQMVNRPCVAVTCQQIRSSSATAPIGRRASLTS